MTVGDNTNPETQTNTQESPTNKPILKNPLQKSVSFKSVRFNDVLVDPKEGPASVEELDIFRNTRDYNRIQRLKSRQKKEKDPNFEKTAEEKYQSRKTMEKVQRLQNKLKTSVAKEKLSLAEAMDTLNQEIKQGVDKAIAKAFPTAQKKAIDSAIAKAFETPEKKSILAKAASAFKSAANTIYRNSIASVTGYAKPPSSKEREH